MRRAEAASPAWFGRLPRAVCELEAIPELEADGAAPAADAAGAKECCKGKNECKGKGDCKTDANACSGKNECKGKGGVFKVTAGLFDEAAPETGGQMLGQRAAEVTVVVTPPGLPHPGSPMWLPDALVPSDHAPLLATVD